MLRSTCRCLFSTFALNPETSAAPHGPPRGLINRYVSMGLPPWAAWCNKVNRYSLYRMSGVAPRTFLPKAPHEMDVIWLNERVRERVRTSRSVQNVYRQLKYPYVKTGIHYSDVLDHWVQVPMVEAAMFEVEKDGGFDNFILKRSGPELRSTYGERIRRHILVRQKEIQKNFVLAQQAKQLAEVIYEEILPLQDEAAAEAVLAKYGIEKQQFLEEMARIVVARKGKANAVDVATEALLP
ncbi:39S ribosomal protein L28 [Trypanosoma rangeli]|uniref:39S ribosomal protein L28 n=1 Tax=Trypanosoma rangeli TaxID=5698 RepID=A0A3R7NH11_TRYRA|nr:39S ribosomal protein L28 [Trypanosoma rangeli]RNF06433.1 39S ribosomal protein L28 [Trypanosoma rangeli]|eukprot:RNF06433.1 39S ribosomal protein L28 [Trypanosoma rangeli]